MMEEKHQSKKQRYSQQTNLRDIFSNDITLAVLARYNVPCVQCPMAMEEIGTLTVGQVCENYGIDCAELLKELNNTA